MARGKATGRYSPDRRSGGDEGGGEEWLTTYADAITLLMAFFVMLYAMSEIDAVKFEAFVAGLAAPFRNEAAGAPTLKPGGGVASTVGMEEPVPAPWDGLPHQIKPLVPVPDETPVEGAGGGAGHDAAQLESVRQRIDDALAASGLADVATYRREERGLAISIASDDVLFDTGSTELEPEGRRIVATLADVLRELPNDVVVEGHTDDVPTAAGDRSNWNLSTDRAVAVLELLVEDLDVSAGRLGAAGYGPHRPLAPNDLPEGRARNRRVDVLVIAQENDDE